MAMHLRQSTAAQAVVIGPFVDSTDGNTAETGLTIDAADIRLSKNGANIVGKNSGGGTHDELGYYTITLDATDTNTVGRLQLMVHEAGALPVYHEYEVLEEAAYDAIYAASADPKADINVATIDANAITATAIAADALTAAKIATGAFTAAKFAADAITSTVIADNAITANKIATGALTAAKFAANALDAVWSTTTRLLTAGTNIVLAKGVGITGFNDLSAAQVNAEVDTAITDAQLATAAAVADLPTNAELAIALGTADDAVLAAVAVVDSNVDAIKVKTDALSFTVAGAVDANVQAVNDVTVVGTGIVGDEWGPIP